MDESEFSQAVERLREINRVVGDLDPAIRAQAFTILSRDLPSSEMDIMKLAFVAMMEAARNAQEDLKAIMEQIKSINEAKKEFRERLCRVQREIDSLCEMSEAENSRLQEAMDEQSKVMTILSNAMKKASDTVEGTTHNIR